MQSKLVKRTSLSASHPELDAKLELLQQLGYGDRYIEDDASLSEKASFDTDRWIRSEYSWALEEAAESNVHVPDLFDVEEDEESCMPYVYDPTFFAASMPPTPRSRSESFSQPRSAVDKPLPTAPLRLRNKPSFPVVPPSSPTTKSTLYSPPSSPPLSPRSSRASRQYSPPSSPSLSRSSALSHRPSSVSPQKRPSAPCHATYPSISSTLSLLEERETEVDKRSAVYVTDSDSEPQFQPGCVPRPMGRGRSCSATVPRSGDLGGPLSISSSPGRKQRPPLPALLTSASSPQLRRLAELATTPSPSFSSLRSPLLPSPMSDMTLTPETEVVTPGEAITLSPENPVEEGAAEPGLASRWSLDSVASRPRINQMALDDASSSPASKTKKRDRLLSLISGRTRSGSVTKPQPPPNTPRGSTDVLDIRYIDSRDTPSPSSRSSSRPSFTMPPKISMAPSLASSDSSTASTASTLATPIESAHPTLSDPFHLDGPSCMQEQVEEEEEEDNLVFADNPYLEPDYPYHHAFPSTSLPHPPPHDLPQAYHESLKLQIPDRPMSPAEPPPQPTLPLPSPSTPSPSFLVPSPRPQSFFASITGRQRRRKKKLVISGAPLELNLSRSSSSVSNAQSSDDYHHRQAEQQRRVQNVVKWCESFGPVRKIETKEDGSLHVYWKDWEVADMVCRIQAQVVIKDVGRVNLAWYYIS